MPNRMIYCPLYLALELEKLYSPKTIVENALRKNAQVKNPRLAINAITQFRIRNLPDIPDYTSENGERCWLGARWIRALDKRYATEELHLACERVLAETEQCLEKAIHTWKSEHSRAPREKNENKAKTEVTTPPQTKEEAESQENTTVLKPQDHEEEPVSVLQEDTQQAPPGQPGKKKKWWIMVAAVFAVFCSYQVSQLDYWHFFRVLDNEGKKAAESILEEHTPTSQIQKAWFLYEEHRYEEAMAILEDTLAPEVEGQRLYILGSIERKTGDPLLAISYLNKAKAIYADQGPKYMLWRCQLAIAGAHATLNEFEQAEALAYQVIEAVEKKEKRTAREQETFASAWMRLTVAALMQEDFEATLSHATQYLEATKPTDSKRQTATAKFYLALANLLNGNIDQGEYLANEVTFEAVELGLMGLYQDNLLNELLIHGYRDNKVSYAQKIKIVRHHNMEPIFWQILKIAENRMKELKNENREHQSAQ